MKSPWILAVLICAMVLPLFGEPIPAEIAGQHIGEEVEVVGIVKGFTNGGDTTYLNFGDAYPRQNFTVTWDETKVAGGRNFHSVIGREVMTKGVVEDYKGTPRIVLKDLADLRVLPVDVDASILGPIDGGAARSRYVAAWQQILETDNFSRIEEQAAAFREDEKVSLEGMWLSPRFFAALSAGPEKGTEEDWQEMFDRFDRWQNEYPDSMAIRHAKAGLLINYAWKARGGGYANTVAKDGWEKFSQRIEEAKNLLETVPAEERRPVFYTLRQTIAMAQGWSKEEVIANLRSCQEKYPEFFEIHFAVCFHLLPRWHGEEFEWEKFIEEETEGGSPYQKELYARAFWAMTDYYDDFWNQVAVSWPRVKAGFEEMERKYPESDWNLNNFARFAMKNDDKETCGRLLKKIEGREDMQVWLRWNQMEDVRRWANED